MKKVKLGFCCKHAAAHKKTSLENETTMQLTVRPESSELSASKNLSKLLYVQEAVTHFM